jgi:ferritin-like metal-binding protein YciE
MRTPKEEEMAQQDMIIAWLNDAFAMENALVRVLEQHAKDAKDQPPLQARLEQHIEETRRHADLVKGCVERLGRSTSAVKTGLANVLGAVQGVSTGPAKDELVKNGLADYAAEQFEVAAYTALIVGAEAIGDPETARVCREILREDEAMAQWLARELPVVVQETLRLEAVKQSS